MSELEQTGKLSIVATPIGNMEDITLRALRTLRECDVIYAEDTRVIAKVLSKYEIKKPLQRLDAATEGKKAQEVVARLMAGEHVVFVSDAGTPGVSDPGSRLVASVRESSRHLLVQSSSGLPHSSSDKLRLRPLVSEDAASIVIEAIPGPSALTTLLSIAGIDATQFTFVGFLPHKKGRQTALKKLSTSTIPVVLYESPHRILKLLAELAVVLPLCRITIGRELTKMHEEVLSGTPIELADSLKGRGADRGEFVLIVEAEFSGW